ncbi:Endopolyphosphatase [Massarina eburnea CBS 473.64]|uniref:Endopolyphosphatase n=1 Tax=Massarina eburnea CBS 473.64 TaxID=1395130 RepID=A0A6A6RRR0_9PLEO|nr:Endopolyphosphatase [Massarina eburnea CBS 473.64]
MGRYRDALVWALLACCTSCRGSSAELDLGLVGGAAIRERGSGSGVAGASTATARRLHGRFLHITDFHPDPFYKTYSSTEHDAACHRKRGPAGYYGAETSGCDSSVALVNATMDWIKRNVADEIDFVVWTGDSARHDNDEKLPRTQRQIIEQNEFMVQKFREVFGKEGGDRNRNDLFKIPIVPTIGNNDVMPHNILLEGPNKWTVKYLDIWKGMVPEAQGHQFQQGGWFWVEVVKDKLAVVSLNTMYFFTSNSGVDGCANKHEPGYEQFEWLRIQLQIMRDRGVSAILIGHVPPAHVNSKESWEQSCWQKYALWEQQYRDVITASFFGHMNVDHFMLQDFEQIKKKARKGKMTTKSVVKKKDEEVGLLNDGEITVASATDYLLDLRKKWAKLPSPEQNGGKPILDYDTDADEEDESSIWQNLLNTFSKSGKGGKKHKKPKTYLDKIGGKYAERYSVSLVSPSIVPNFFPTLRILEYNITGLEDAFVSPVETSQRPPRSPSDQAPLTGIDLLDDEAYVREVQSVVKRKQKNKQKEMLKKKRTYKFKVPAGPSKASPPGPAYSPQSLTLLGYTQYFANLTYINNDFVEDSTSISPSPSSPQTIFGLKIDEDGEIEDDKWKEGKHGKHQGKKPRPEPHPKEFKFEVEYDTRTDKKYKLKDLTVRRWVNLARRIGEKGKTSGMFKDEEELGYESEDDAGEDEREEYEVMDEESDAEEDDEDEDEDEVDTDDAENTKKGNKGKKHKKKHGKNSTWYTFVRRAFVSTMDPREIEQVFGAQEDPPSGELREEVMEL